MDAADRILRRRPFSLNRQIRLIRHCVTLGTRRPRSGIRLDHHLEASTQLDSRVLRGDVGSVPRLGGVGGEVASGLDDLAQLVVERLDGDGGVDDPAGGRVEVEEGGEAFPVASPQLDDRRLGVAPVGSEVVEGHGGGVCGRGLIDGPQSRGDLLSARLLAPTRLAPRTRSGRDLVRNAAKR